jgi:geranylgeranyl pyrophosphate synthase
MSELQPFKTGLAEFVTAVNARLRTVVGNASFHADQRRLLAETVERFERHADPTCYTQPLGLMYLGLRACGAEVAARAVQLGAFCMLYTCSLDLFDDVQDEDLAGKPHAEAGPAIATNSALALFFLALDELRSVIAGEADPAIRLKYLEVLNRVSLSAVGAQHADLLGAAGVSNAAEVLDRDRGKTSAIGLFLECAALLSGCSERVQDGFTAVGGDLAPMAQIVDDLRDIYGKSESPDLATDKLSYPVACLREQGTKEQFDRFVELRAQHPQSLPAIRELLYEAGVVEHCALTIDELRTLIHEQVAQMPNQGSAHRMLLSIVDSLARSLYEPESVASTARLWQPVGGFHDSVRSARDRFVERVVPAMAANPPRLEPWHLPHYLYEPSSDVIYYPDVDGLPEEVLPFHAELYGLDDPARVVDTLSAQAPAMIAHEMFHCLRHRAGRLTEDDWHEEYVANRLAVGYLERFEPAVLTAVQEQLQTLAGRHSLTAAGRAILERCAGRRPVTSGYGVGALETATVHAHMIIAFLERPGRFEADLDGLLGSRSTRRADVVDAVACDAA